jgi:hypothetical protein
VGRIFDPSASHRPQDGDRYLRTSGCNYQCHHNYHYSHDNTFENIHLLFQDLLYRQVHPDLDQILLVQAFYVV